MRNLATLVCVLLSLLPRQILSRDLPSSPGLVNQVCETTLYKDICKSTLSSFPDSDKVDLNELTKRSLKQASLNGSHISEQISQWLMQPTIDEAGQQCLYDCAQNYEDAVEQLEDSFVALETKKYADVQTWVSAAMSDMQSCKEECNDNAQLAQMSVVFNQLCSNVLALVKLLSS